MNNQANLRDYTPSLSFPPKSNLCEKTLEYQWTWTSTATKPSPTFCATWRSAREATAGPTAAPSSEWPSSFRTASARLSCGCSSSTCTPFWRGSSSTMRCLWWRRGRAWSSIERCSWTWASWRRCGWRAATGSALCFTMLTCCPRTSGICTPAAICPCTCQLLSVRTNTSEKEI